MCVPLLRLFVFLPSDSSFRKKIASMEVSIFAKPSAESEEPRYGYNVGCNLVYQFPTTQFADAKYYGDPTWHHGRAVKLEWQVRSN